MKVIDMYLRPPIEGFLRGSLYNDPVRAADYCRRWDVSLPESVKQQSMELLLQEMDELQVVGVVPARKRPPYFMNNDEIVKLVEAYPGHFIGMAAIDGNAAIEETMDEIDRYAISGPCVGMTFEPGYFDPETPLDDPRFEPIFEKCQKNNVPLLLPYGGNCNRMIRCYQPVMIDNVCLKFPDLHIVLTHGGWPYVAEMCYIAFKRPNLYLSPDVYGVHTPGSDGYYEAANYYLHDKMIFGSCYPSNSIKDLLDYNQARVHEECWQEYFHENAVRALNLKGI